MEFMMVEKKDHRKTPGKKASGGQKDDEPDKTIRLYTREIQKLIKLSTLRGDPKVAFTFRAVFGKLLDAELISAANNTITETQGEDS